MEKYEPPFEITNKILALVSSIGEKVGRITAYRELEKKPQLRRNNRILSVHASLKIESNSLSEGTVRAVLNDRPVIGPEKEIQEVKNAFAAYEAMDGADPYSVEELKRLHGIMTRFTVEESGVFRHGNEGVFEGDRCIFMAPPPQYVPSLIDGLFEWMRQNRGIVHPLVLSSVFHYEFVFIHPFSDGNGRMARLWQTMLLAEWNPVFKYVPIESRIEQYQDGYYKAIAACNANGSSTVFIEYMLACIDSVLDLVLSTSGGDGMSKYVSRLLGTMEYGILYTAEELLAKLGLKSREALRRNYLAPALEAGAVEMTLPEKPTSRNQQYRKV